jgi:hypothetical protein
MRSHLRLIGHVRDRASRPSTEASLSARDDVDMENDYSVIFREYFCVAADELAGMLDTPLQDLGVLYNGILTTGSISHEFQRGSRRKANADLEQGIKYPIMFGKGQLLFLVRTVDKHESAKLLTQGYRFAPVKNVSDIIARTMKVGHEDIIDTIERLQLYSQPRKPLSAAGTYLACFAIRPAIKSALRNWDILVPTDRPGDLPCVELSSEPLNTLELSRLSKLDSLSVAQCITYLNNIAAEITDVEEKNFIERLLDIITELTRQVPEDFFRHAIFSCKAVAAPGLGDDRDGSPPQIYAFSVIPDVHIASVKSTAVTYVPLSFFQCIQRVYKHSPDHDILAQRIHREFGTILSHKDVAANTSRRVSRSNHIRNRTNTSLISTNVASNGGTSRDSRRGSRLSIPSTQRSKVSTPQDSASTPILDARGPSLDQEPLAGEKRQRQNSGPRRPSLVFGGIMVSSDTKVEVCEKTEIGEGATEMQAWGVSAQATVASEQPTYVDELFRMTSKRWQQR